MTITYTFAPPTSYELAVGSKLLDTMILTVCYIYIIFVVDCYSIGTVELSIPTAIRTPFGNKIAVI